MKKLFTLLAALLFLGGLMAQESNYYLYLSERSWDDGDRFNLEWNAGDGDYQLEIEFDPGIYEFMIVTWDGGDPTFALGYNNVDLEESCAGIREGEDNKIKVIITTWYAGLKIHVNAEGNSVVIECVYDCENIITADYVLLFRENGAWDLDHPVLMDNNTASVNKSAGTYQFEVAPLEEYYDQMEGGSIEYDHIFHFDKVEHDCSSNYYREGEDGSIKVTLAEEGNINVSVNGDHLCVQGTFAAPDYFLVGSFSGEDGWDLDLADPMYDNTYSDWLDAGTYEFKVVTPAIISGEDTNWTGALGYDALDPECSSENIQEGTNGNIKVTLAEGGDVTVTYLAGYVCVTGDFVNPSAPTITSWTVAGGAEITGVLWDPTVTANDMEESNGTWTLVKTGVEIAAAGTYYYKVAANHAWGVEEFPAAGNQSLYISQPGTYTITYTWVPAENSLTATAVEQTTWTIAGEEAIAGVLWNVEYTDNDMIGSNGTWTLVKYNVVLTELRNYYYKVARNHSWEVSYPAEGNQTLAIYKRGTYNITYTWVPAENSLTAEATWLGWPTDIENADATTVRKLIENGQLVIIRDGKRYNAQGQLVK